LNYTRRRSRYFRVGWRGSKGKIILEIVLRGRNAKSQRPVDPGELTQSV